MFRQGGAWGNGLVFALAAVALLDARAARDAAGVGEVQPGAAGEVERTDMFKQLPVEDVASMEGARWAGKRAQQVADGSLGEAYVTLCYRESYVLGVRVLGKSLRETGTTKDMVVLVTGISDLSVETLEMDGWIVKRVKMVANPGLGPSRKGRGGFPARFWAVYTKLTVFNLIEYRKLIYLDADVLVLSNLDHLFACRGFCAVMRAGERFNSGLMALDPSAAVYEDMMEQMFTIPSYTGGDQGFLNVYFKDIINAPIFEPLHSGRDVAVHRTTRLRTEYNSDIGGYVLNAGLWHQSGEPKVLHYTLGPFKPWQWWMSWVTEQHSMWLKVKARLGEDASGYTGGRHARALLAEWLLVPLAALLFAWMLRYQAWDAGLQQCLAEMANDARLFMSLAVASCVGLGSGVLSLALTILLVVPNDISPAIAWVLVYEWTLLGLTIGTARLMRVNWQLGQALGDGVVRRSDMGPFGNGEEMFVRVATDSATPREAGVPSGGSQAAPSSTVVQAWRVTVRGAISSAAFLALSPWISRIFDINDIVAKILITSLSGVLALLWLCHSLGGIASAWFSAGVNDSGRRDAVD